MNRKELAPKLLAIGLALGLTILLPAAVRAQGTDQPSGDNPAATEPSQQPIDQQQAESSAPQIADQAQPAEPSDSQADQDQVAQDSDSDTMSADNEALPRTASPLGLLALLGLAGIGTAVGVGTLRRS